MKDVTPEVVKKMIQSAMNSNWEAFKESVLDSLTPPIPPDAEVFLKRVFEDAFQSGVMFMSMYMANMMLVSKLESMLGEEVPVPSTKPTPKKSSAPMSPEELLKAIFNSQIPPSGN